MALYLSSSCHICLVVKTVGLQNYISQKDIADPKEEMEFIKDKACGLQG